MKELGFDEPCFSYYKNDQLSEILEEVINSEMRNVNNEIDDYISAPTFSQCFRWFREKYGYDVSIKKCTPSEYKFEIEQLFVEGDNYYFIDFVFKTYEEAELECLRKLIEIVKKNGKVNI
jgi:hypothetical protein